MVALQGSVELGGVAPGVPSAAGTDVKTEPVNTQVSRTLLLLFVNIEAETSPHRATAFRGAQAAQGRSGGEKKSGGCECVIKEGASKTLVQL